VISGPESASVTEFSYDLVKGSRVKESSWSSCDSPDLFTSSPFTSLPGTAATQTWPDPGDELVGHASRVSRVWSVILSEARRAESKDLLPADAETIRRAPFRPCFPCGDPFDSLRSRRPPLAQGDRERLRRPQGRSLARLVADDRPPTRHAGRVPHKVVADTLPDLWSSRPGCRAEGRRCQSRCRRLNPPIDARDDGSGTMLDVSSQASLSPCAVDPHGMETGATPC
jgi:hypothetical protein